jgi:hypothetical protein
VVIVIGVVNEFVTKNLVRRRWRIFLVAVVAVEEVVATDDDMNNEANEDDDEDDDADTIWNKGAELSGGLC